MRSRIARILALYIASSSEELAKNDTRQKNISRGAEQSNISFVAPSSEE